MEYILPNSKRFTLWKDETVYTDTIWVDQGCEIADDKNVGTKNAPFRTINAALRVAKAGDHIVIRGGIYRECVCPILGGIDAKHMLMIEGMPGEKVVITGTEEFSDGSRVSVGWKRNAWQPDTPYGDNNAYADESAQVWMYSFPKGSFIDQNPFTMTNTSHYMWYQYHSNAEVCNTYYGRNKEEQRVLTMRRGLIFANGKRLKQVHDYWALGSTQNAFWVEDDGMTVHFRLDDITMPDNIPMTYTARCYALRPESRGLGYIHLRNLTFSGCGNGFPPPQTGMVSTNCGHHWLIESCDITEANGIGMDIGQLAPMCFGDIPKGGHIIRDCTFSQCGIAGLSGVPGSTEDTIYLDSLQSGILVENNRFYNNNWQNAVGIMEMASIKLHHLKDSMIINNHIYNCGYGAGIWVDASNENVAVKGNVIIHCPKIVYGGIFIEASHDDIEVAYNIIADVQDPDNLSGGNGIFTTSGENISEHHNMLLNCQRFGICNTTEGRDRIYHGTGHSGYNIDICDNIFADCRWAMLSPTQIGKVDGNIYGHFTTGGYLKLAQPELHLNLKNWQRYLDRDKNAIQTDINYIIDDDNHQITLKIGTYEKTIDLSKPVIDVLSTIMSDAKQQ